MIEKSSKHSPSPHLDVARKAVEESEATLDEWLTPLVMCSDPTRLRILVAIHAAPEANVTELAEAARITPNATTQALRRLEDSGLVLPRRDGRHRRWSLTDPRIHELLHLVSAPHTELHPEHKTFPENHY